MKILCRIRAIRKEQKLTQEELADKLGISRQSIISVESGKSLPSLSLALQISQLFDRAIEDIFNFHENIKKAPSRILPRFYSGQVGVKEVYMPRDLTPFRPFGMGRFFDEDFGEMDFPKSMQTNSPAINVYEKGSEVIVEAQLPGIDPEEVKVDISENVLKISGEKRDEKSLDGARDGEEKEKNFYRREISIGSFARSIALPNNVDTSHADAEYNDGILKIKMPKIASKESKSIKVKIKKK